jgi:MOSC domain-containing protein YiiM
MPNGMFGENFTIEGLMEKEVSIGDVFQIGSSRVIATQPRMPCYKLGVKFGRMDVLKKFLASGRSGIYFKVSKEGEVGAGDTIEQIGKDPNRITISDIIRLYASEKEDIESMRRAVKVEALPEGWKHHFLEQINLVEKNKGKNKRK